MSTTTKKRTALIIGVVIMIGFTYLLISMDRAFQENGGILEYKTTFVSKSAQQIKTELDEHKIVYSDMVQARVQDRKEIKKKDSIIQVKEMTEEEKEKQHEKEKRVLMQKLAREKHQKDSIVRVLHSLIFNKSQLAE